MSNYNDTEQESVNKTFAGEKKKLAQMTFPQKLEYIFSYYKFHILIVIIAIAAIIWFIHNRMTYVEYKLYGVVIDSSQVNEELEDTFPEMLGMGKHEGFSMVAGLSSNDSVMGSYYNQIDIFTVSGQIDFAFTDEAGVKYLCDMGTPWDITEELPTELQDLLGGDVVTFSQRDPDTDEYFDNYAAIDISGSKIAEYFGLEDHINYLVILGYPAENEYMDDLYDILIQIENGSIN